MSPLSMPTKLFTSVKMRTSISGLSMAQVMPRLVCFFCFVLFFFVCVCLCFWLVLCFVFVLFFVFFCCCFFFCLLCCGLFFFVGVFFCLLWFFFFCFVFGVFVGFFL